MGMRHAFLPWASADLGVCFLRTADASADSDLHKLTPEVLSPRSQINPGRRMCDGRFARSKSPVRQSDSRCFPSANANASRRHAPFPPLPDSAPQQAGEGATGPHPSAGAAPSYKNERNY